LRENGLLNRVKLIPAGVGTTDQLMYLNDAGSSSRLSHHPRRQRYYQVQVLDLFKTVKLATIDLLKIDIEGDEYNLLADSRFPDLNAQALVLEWHETSDYLDARAWCIDRLNALRYRTLTGVEDLPLGGLIWGFRTS
jgi:hypothetical protein